MIHVLKIWPEPFELIRLGVKTAEVRYESGREFRSGDVLRLREFDPQGTGYTGREITAHVTEALLLQYTPREWQLHGGIGIVVMSLRVLKGGSS